MTKYNTDIHGTHPMSDGEVWHRGKCPCLNEAGIICSEHGRPHDRMGYQFRSSLPDQPRDA